MIPGSNSSDPADYCIADGLAPDQTITLLWSLAHAFQLQSFGNVIQVEEGALKRYLDCLFYSVASNDGNFTAVQVISVSYFS